MKNRDELAGKVPEILKPQKYPSGEMSGEADYTEGRSVTGVHAAIQREKPEPGHERDLHEGIGKFPIWMLLLFAGVIFVAGGYLTVFSGGFSKSVYDSRNWNVSMLSGGGPGAGDEEVKSAKPPRELGKIVYGQNCVACHQANGQGLPGVNPPLAESDWVTGSEKRLAAILLHGMGGPVEVKGQTYNGAMPAWGGNLSSEQIANTLTYIRSEWGNKASAIVPAQIDAAREELKGRTAPWTAAELQQIPADALLPGAENAAPPQP